MSGVETVLPLSDGEIALLILLSPVAAVTAIGLTRLALESVRDWVRRRRGGGR